MYAGKAPGYGARSNGGRSHGINSRPPISLSAQARAPPPPPLTGSTDQESYGLSSVTNKLYSLNMKEKDAHEAHDIANRDPEGFSGREPEGFSSLPAAAAPGSPPSWNAWSFNPPQALVDSGEYTDEEEDDEGGLYIHTTEDGVYFYGAPGTEFNASQSQPQGTQTNRNMNWKAAVGATLPAEDDGGSPSFLRADNSSLPASRARPTAPSGPVCKFFLQGNCRYGNYCRYSHQLTGGQSAGEVGEEDEESMVASEVEFSRSLECHICYENVIERGQRFGLLSGCSHPFCLDCIRNWRGNIDQSKESVRMCPVCRLPSYFIVPSYRMISDPERKNKVIEEFKANTSKIHCKHFKRGNGTCPFGSSCFFAHVYEDGIPAETHFRTALNAEGKYDLVPQVRLANFCPDVL